MAKLEPARAKGYEMAKSKIVWDAEEPKLEWSLDVDAPNIDVRRLAYNDQHEVWEQVDRRAAEAAEHIITGLPASFTAFGKHYDGIYIRLNANIDQNGRRFVWASGYSSHLTEAARKAFGRWAETSAFAALGRVQELKTAKRLQVRASIRDTLETVIRNAQATLDAAD